MTALHVCLLGDFKLEQNGELITTVKRARLQSLLTYLLLHSHAPQPCRVVSFQLWPDSSEQQAHNNLRKALHQLRGALARGHGVGAGVHEGGHEDVGCCIGKERPVARRRPERRSVF